MKIFAGPRECPAGPKEDAPILMGLQLKNDSLKNVATRLQKKRQVSNKNSSQALNKNTRRLNKLFFLEAWCFFRMASRVCVCVCVGRGF